MTDIIKRKTAAVIGAVCADAAGYSVCTATIQYHWYYGTRVSLMLVYVHMYTAYDIRRPIGDSEFCFNLPNILSTFI